MSYKIFVNIACNFLQEIRLIHAISESSHTIVVPKALDNRFVMLKQKLGMSYEIGCRGDILLSEHMAISHLEPTTRFGSISHPLVFPNAMVNNCLERWAKSRLNRFTFTGLIDQKREKVIGSWAIKTFGESLPRLVTQERQSFVPNRIKKLFGFDNSVDFRVGELQIKSSNRGRIFPQKSWDNDYYKNLSESQFVLCPSGDCIWSYRFFESILCGAIPIVENSCPAMEEFQYINLNQDARNLNWSLDIAQHNLILLKKRFTFSPGEVDNEVAHIIKNKNV
jgi:hypothetical protein